MSLKLLVMKTLWTWSLTFSVTWSYPLRLSPGCLLGTRSWNLGASFRARGLRASSLSWRPVIHEDCGGSSARMLGRYGGAGRGFYCREGCEGLLLHPGGLEDVGGKLGDLGDAGNDRRGP